MTGARERRCTLRAPAPGTLARAYQSAYLHICMSLLDAPDHFGRVAARIHTPTHIPKRARDARPAPPMRESRSALATPLALILIVILSARLASVHCPLGLEALQAPPVAPAARYVCALSEVSRLDSPPPHVRGIGCAGCCMNAASRLHVRAFDQHSFGWLPTNPPALSAAAMARRLRGGAASWAQGEQSFPRAGRVRGAARHCARAGAQTPAKRMSNHRVAFIELAHIHACGLGYRIEGNANRARGPLASVRPAPNPKRGTGHWPRRRNGPSGAFRVYFIVHANARRLRARTRRTY